MTPCSVPTCTRPAYRRGMCAGHRSRFYAHGETFPEIPLAAAGLPLSERARVSPSCPSCGSDFYVCAYTANDKGQPVSWRCCSCRETFVLSEEAVAS